MPPCCVFTLVGCDICYNSAVLWGLIICKDPSSPVTVSFGWDSVSHEGAPGDYANWTPGNLWFGGLFYATLSGLEPDSTYYFRARAQAGEYTCYGEERCFTTELRVVTLPARDIETNKATIYGKTIGWFRSPKVRVSFGWDTESYEDNPAGYAHWTSPKYARIGETFDARLKNLKPDTTYYFRAKVERDGVVFYGEELSFTTKKKKHSLWGWWDWF